MNATKNGGFEISNSSSMRKTPSKQQRQLRFHESSDTSHERNVVGISVNGEDVQDVARDEDSTDGMGAVVFTDEEDCGFFGTRSPPLIKKRLLSLWGSHLTLSQVHPQTSLLHVTFPAR